MTDSAPCLAGKLLVAPAAMTDPNFAEAVTLVLIHNNEGAFGLVLDRAVEAEVSSETSWASLVDTRVWSGGPCEPERFIPIGRPKPGRLPSHYQPLCDRLGGLGVVDLDSADHDDFEAVRFFLGYAGWAPGQLDWEVNLDAWVVADAHPDDPFAIDVAGLRGRVLRRVLADGHGSMVFPDDPTSN